MPFLHEQCCVQLRWNKTNKQCKYQIMTPNSPWTNVSTFLVDTYMAVVEPRFLNRRFPKSVSSHVLGSHSFLKSCAEQIYCKRGCPFHHFEILHSVFRDTCLSFVRHFTSVTNFDQPNFLFSSKQNACTNIFWTVSMQSALNLILYHN